MTSDVKLKVIKNVDIDELNLSVRAWNCLRRANLDTVQDIVNNYDNLSRVRNLGQKCHAEVLDKIKPYVEIFASIQNQDGFSVTCKDCIGYNFCSDYEKYSEAEVKEFSEQGTVQDLCSSFKNKADFVEVVRCKDCKHRQETAHRSYCLPVFGLKQITDLNAYCNYGERKTDDAL